MWARMSTGLLLGFAMLSLHCHPPTVISLGTPRCPYTDQVELIHSLIVHKQEEVLTTQFWTFSKLLRLQCQQLLRSKAVSSCAKWLMDRAGEGSLYQLQRDESTLLHFHALAGSSSQLIRPDSHGQHHGSGWSPETSPVLWWQRLLICLPWHPPSTAGWKRDIFPASWTYWWTVCPNSRESYPQSGHIHLDNLALGHSVMTAW